jgi:hypothetical protein
VGAFHDWSARLPPPTSSRQRGAFAHPGAPESVRGFTVRGRGRGVRRRKSSRRRRWVTLRHTPGSAVIRPARSSGFGRTPKSGRIRARSRVPRWRHAASPSRVRAAERRGLPPEGPAPGCLASAGRAPVARPRRGDGGRGRHDPRLREARRRVTVQGHGRGVVSAMRGVGQPKRSPQPRTAQGVAREIEASVADFVTSHRAAADAAAQRALSRAGQARARPRARVDHERAPSVPG